MRGNVNVKLKSVFCLKFRLKLSRNNLIWIDVNQSDVIHNEVKSEIKTTGKKIDVFWKWIVADVSVDTLLCSLGDMYMD